jgi:ubiquinone/menaquinone biosynthesis C-methylase UbiE
MMDTRSIPAEDYGRDFYLNPLLEGFDEYCRGSLSTVKSKQLEMLRIEPGSRVLDVGFGRGELLLHCAKRGAHVAGVDYSEAAFDIAKETLGEFRNADLRVADCKALPFADHSFDRVVSGDLIEHVSFDDGIQALREMYRVTAPGGFLLVHTTPNTFFTRLIYPCARPILHYANPHAVQAIDAHLEVMRHFHVYEYNLFTLRRAASSAGLRDVKVWIDPDVMRAGEHRHTRPFARHPLARIAAAAGKLTLGRILFGNDIYLLSTKQV